MYGMLPKAVQPISKREMIELIQRNIRHLETALGYLPVEPIDPPERYSPERMLAIYRTLYLSMIE